ncbi:MAG: GAF domain-containing protein, partial [Proteobacteria bacterium]
LEETSESIQTLNDVQTMLDKTLKDTCTRFKFDRAFLMLASPDGKELRTSSVFCEDSDLDMIWKFTVDLTVTREKGFFVSSIFHSGQPVFIENVEDHLFHFNDVSKKIIQRLRSKSYAMVPVPGANGRLGVLIADRIDAKQTLVRTDMVLLERIARQLGLALDKQTQLDHERSMRKAFQKYVPRHIVDEIAAERGGVRGGTTGEIVSLILDIRSFTEKSKSISPADLLNWLNRFYENTVPFIEASGGYVERYLGDGFLATWGSIDRIEVNIDKVMTSALDVIESLDAFNQDMRSVQLPEIQVGMGIARGQAVSGNVGSQNRIEFTSLGTVVNFSARLEELCKPLETSLVVSMDIYNELSDYIKDQMTVVSNVGVDSFADVPAVAVLQLVNHQERVA